MMKPGPNLQMAAQRVLMRCDKNQVIDDERKGFHFGSRDSLIAGDPYIGEIGSNCADDRAARPLFQVNVDIRMSGEEAA